MRLRYHEECRSWALILALALGGSAFGQNPVRLEQRSPAEMSAADRAMVATRTGSISRAASLYGYRLDSTFSYRQTICTGAPDAIVLNYRAGAPGHESVFTAAINREKNPEEPVLILPVLISGVVPFLPPAQNPGSIEMLNRIFLQARSGNWMSRALCFVALVGEAPAALQQPAVDRATMQAPEPTLTQERDRIVQTLALRGSTGGYQVWTFTFAQSGKLLGVQSQQQQSKIQQEIASVPTRPATRASVRGETQQEAVDQRLPTEPASPAELDSRPLELAHPPVPANAPVASNAGNAARAETGRPTSHAAANGTSSEPTQSSSASTAISGPMNPAMPPVRIIPEPPAPPSRFIPDPPEPQQ